MKRGVLFQAIRVEGETLAISVLDLDSGKHYRFEIGNERALDLGLDLVKFAGSRLQDSLVRPWPSDSDQPVANRG